MIMHATEKNECGRLCIRVCVRVRACLCSIAAAKVLKSCREDLTEMVTFEDLKGLRE